MTKMKAKARTKAKSSTARIKSAASESLQQGGNIHEKGRDLTLHALTSRRFEPGQIMDVVRAMTEGITLGTAKRGGDTKHALSQAFAGIDEALTKSAEASRLALQELVSKAKDLNDSEVAQVLTHLRRLDDDFLSTVSSAADSAEQKIKTELHDLVSHARHTGTDTGAKVAETLGEFTSRTGSLMLDTAKAGVDTALEMSARFTELAGGILSGMADALQDKSKRARSKWPRFNQHAGTLVRAVTTLRRCVSNEGTSRLRASIASK